MLWAGVCSGTLWDVGRVVPSVQKTLCSWLIRREPERACAVGQGVGCAIQKTYLLFAERGDVDPSPSGCVLCALGLCVGRGVGCAI